MHRNGEAFEQAERHASECAIVSSRHRRQLDIYRTQVAVFMLAVKGAGRGP